MHLIEEHYYTINKAFLKILGIWPYDRSRLVFLQRLLIIILAVTYIALQLSVFITTRFNMALFVKTMSLVFPSVLITIKYCIFIFKLKTVRVLHHRIQEDWKIMRDKLENDIIQKNAHDCQIYTLFIFWFAGIIVVAVIVVQFLPVILDLVSPLDKPRPRKSLITVEYFICQDNYFYTRILHELIIISLCVSIVLATATQMLLFAYHSFGMFKIASHRIEHSINDNVLHMPNGEKDCAICKRIIHVVIAHRRAIQFSNIFISSFNIPFCILAIVGVLSLSVNLFRFVEAAMVSKNMEDMLISFFTILGHLVYMFVGNYIGQIITDCNNEIFRLIYGTSWYLMPVTSQKLILFLMRRAGKDFYYVLGFIFVAKVENFATLVNTALSYVAVIYSIQ